MGVSKGLSKGVSNGLSQGLSKGVSQGEFNCLSKGVPQGASRVRPRVCPRGRDLLWPRLTLATTYFGHCLADFGHGQFWAFSRLRRGGEEGGGGRGNEGPKVGPRGVEAPRGGGPEGWRPRGVEAQNFALIFPFPPPIFIIFSLSGDLLVSFSSLWGSFRVFFAFSGCFFVEFWAILVQAISVRTLCCRSTQGERFFF